MDLLKSKKSRSPSSAEREDTRYWAETYLAKNRLLHYRGTDYLFDGKKYVEFADLTVHVRKFLLLHPDSPKHDNNRISNIAANIKALCLHDARRFPAMPFYWGNDATFPKPSHVIAFGNGLLDVRKYLDSGETDLRPHTPHWASTICLPYDFDPQATCGGWLDYLTSIFGEGDGRASRFGLAQLADKLVATVGEANLEECRDKHMILETLNSIVGGDPQSIERKYHAQQSVVLPTRFSISCNQEPTFIDPSGALAARMLFLPFDRSFVGSEDRNLAARLEKEVGGICNWAIEGYRRLIQNNGFSVPGRSREIVNDYRRANSLAFAFAQDCLLVESRISPGNLDGVRTTGESLSVPKKHVQYRFDLWCTEVGRHGTFAYLGRDLKAILPGLKDGKEKGERTYVGVALAPDSPV